MRDEHEVAIEGEKRAREALGMMEAPGADPDFRATLKRSFASGAIGAPEHEAAIARDRGALRPGWDAQARPAPEWRRPALAWAGAVLALAAVMLVVVALDRGPRWEAISASGDGIAVIGDQPVPLAHLDELGQRLGPGVRVRIPGGSELEIAAAGNLAISITSGTDVTLPRTPGRWFSRGASAEVRSGELRITTGPRFRGARLAIATPAARVEVKGTTLAVICDPEGTCVCVLEGTVGVGPRAGPMLPVGGGKRRFVYDDGRPPVLDSIRPGEITQLGRFRDRSRRVLGAEGR